MENYIKRITPEMTKTVNELMQRNFDNATPDEIAIYSEWVKLRALQADEIAQLREKREKELEASKAAIKEESEKALNALNALTELAKAKLKAVENG